MGIGHVLVQYRTLVAMGILKYEHRKLFASGSDWLETNHKDVNTVSPLLASLGVSHLTAKFY